MQHEIKVSINVSIELKKQTNSIDKNKNNVSLSFNGEIVLIVNTLKSDNVPFPFLISITPVFIVIMKSTLNIISGCSRIIF